MKQERTLNIETLMESDDERNWEQFETIANDDDDNPDEDDAEKFSIDKKEEEEFNDSRYERREKNLFNCKLCSKSFLKRSTLKIHEASHENRRDFTCTRDECSSAFNILPRLIRHLRNVHSADEDEIVAVRNDKQKELPAKEPKPAPSSRASDQTRVQCEVCSKVVASVKYLREHMTLQHLGDAPYRCDKRGCGKKFIDWSLMQKHRRKHEGKFDFKCEYCGKGYVQRKTLNQHLRGSHQISKEEIEAMNKTNNICIECDKTFNTTEKLYEHRALQHGTGEKYICDMCAKIFVSRVKLISHQKYHRDEKKNKCKICPSLFTEDKGLKTHLRRVHKLTEAEIYEMFPSF